jgi:chromosome partitioning protein
MQPDSRTTHPPATQVLCACMRKGGVLKSSLVRWVTSVLTETGKQALLSSPARVLAVDLDPQSNLTQMFIGIERTANLERSLYNVLVEKAPLSGVLLPITPQIDLAPSNVQMELTEYALINERRREDRLKQALEPIKARYDYVLLDCPPNLGLLTVNALSAADSVIVPCETDFLALASLPLTLNTIHDVTQEINPHLRLLGIVATKHKPHTNMGQQALAKLTHDLHEAGLPLFATVIKDRTKYREANALQQGITDYAPATEEAASMRALVKEIINGK